jgi:hypothetical protein
MEIICGILVIILVPIAAITLLMAVLLPFLALITAFLPKTDGVESETFFGKVFKWARPLDYEKWRLKHPKNICPPPHEEEEGKDIKELFISGSLTVEEMDLVNKHRQEKEEDERRRNAVAMAYILSGG